MRNFYYFLRIILRYMYGRIYDDERNPKLYLVESQVPRVASFLGLRKAREQPESDVSVHECM
jgi:hypothetical protein